MLEQLIYETRQITDFSDTEIDKFVSLLEASYVAKGDYFLREGQVSKHIGYLNSGLLMYYKVVDGVEVPADFARENEWVAYLKSFSAGIPSDMNIKAIEDTYLYVLSNQKMGALFQEEPKFMALKSYYTELSFIRNTEHTSNLATLDAKQRYYKLMEAQPDLLNRVPQYYIAAYFGIKPQSLSRLRKERP